MSGSTSDPGSRPASLSSVCLEQLPIGLATYAADGSCVQANPAMADAVGATVEQLLAENFRRIASWQGTGLLEAAERVLRTGERCQVEFDAPTTFGKRVCLECSFDRVEIEGEPYLQLVVLDITERKQTEEQLRFQAEILDTVYDAVIYMDAAFTVLRWNKGAERIYGWTAEQAVGRSSLEALDPVYESPEERQAIYDAFVRDGRFVGEVTHRHRDGTPRPIWASVTMIRDAAGEFVGAISINRDQTELKQEQEARAAFEAGVEALLEVSPDALVTLDLRGRVQLVSARAVELFGFDSAEGLRGSDGLALVAEVDRPSAAESLALAGTGEGPDVVRYTMLRGDGSTFDAEMTSAVMVDDAGRAQGLIVTIRDVTERLRAEQERSRIDKLESLGILAGGVAHDFNNILTGVIANLSLALEEVRAGEDSTSSVAAALAASRRASGLTRQLLTFSKGGAPVKETESVGDLVAETASFALSGSRCRDEIDIAEDLWPADIDQGQISQVIENLVINADQATPDGGVIRIAVVNHEEVEGGAPTVPDMVPGRYVRISVADDGIGIAEKHLDKVFDPFFTTKQKGSGLGLTTSFSIARRHDGYLMAASAVGTGATFTLYLPASDSEPKITLPRHEPAGRGTGRILVMDDEELLLSAATRILARQGYRVSTAVDGEECLAAYARALEEGEPFDLVIMDLTIPGGLGGAEAIDRLRRLDPGARALVSSGYSNDPVMSDPAAHGFQGAVIKPYTLAILGETVARTLREKN